MSDDRLFEPPTTKPYRPGRPAGRPIVARRPTHLHDGNSPTTRCGISMRSDARFPYVQAPHAPMHIAGWNMVVCPTCAAVAHLETGP